MIQELDIILPLPNMELSANRKHGKNWNSTKKAKDKDKEIGYWLCKQRLSEINLTFSKNDKLTCILYFWFKDARNRDWGNLATAYKAMEDGIFAALEIDDGQIIECHIKKGINKINPHLYVILKKIS